MRLAPLVALAVLACGGAPAPAPVAATYVVELPAAREDPEAVCPADTVAEHGVCVRVLASPEIPAWEPPRGHGDPCATWTSEKGLFDCDVKNENPADGGL